MGSPLSVLFKSPEAQVRLLRLRVSLVGLARDFWKDAPFDWSFGFSQKSKETLATKAANKVAKEISGATAPATPAGPQPWSGDRIQVIERMWGEGHAFPGNDNYIDSLVTPLGMNKEMSILDLSAGLGGMARKIAADFGSYVTGLEVDSTLASRGMIMSIAAGKAKQATITAYNPETYEPTRKYDCVFARELFYKVVAKEKFFKAIAGSLKSGGGQLVFTDYLLDSVSRAKPAIRQWFEREPNAAPLTLPETIKYWKGFGFDLRVAEDQTDLYHTEILKGFTSLVEHINMNVPDRETKLLLLREIDLWAQRIHAFKGGLKYYRFYGIKY